jgi:hypothetical protein
MIKYFKELLQTLKNIEKHLEGIASCITFAGRGGHGRAMQIKDSGRFNQ